MRLISKVAPEKQKWPFIKKRKYPSGEVGWMVDARTKTGGERKTFGTKGEAETFAAQCRIVRTNSGDSAFGSEELAQYGKTVHDAVAFLLAHLRREEKSIPLETAIAEMIETKKGAGKSADYQYKMKLTLGRFAAENPGRSIASFTTADLDSWLIGLKKASPGTRNTFRRDLHTLFSFCKKRGYCATNPAEATERAVAIDAPPGILTPAQATALLLACGPDIQAYIAIALFAGLRASELEKLDWSEIAMVYGPEKERPESFIEVTAVKSKTKRRRLVPISWNLKGWLWPLLLDIGPVAPQGLRKRILAARERAGLVEWPSNAMRHSYGSYRLAQCHDAARVSLEMGNSPAMVFAHYRELVKPRDMEAFWAIAPSDSAP